MKGGFQHCKLIVSALLQVFIPFIGAAGHIALRVILSRLFIQDYQLPAVAFCYRYWMGFGECALGNLPICSKPPNLSLLYINKECSTYSEYSLLIALIIPDIFITFSVISLCRCHLLQEDSSPAPLQASYLPLNF